MEAEWNIKVMRLAINHNRLKKDYFAMVKTNEKLE